MAISDVLSSVNLNPNTANIAQNAHSTDWLWAAFALLCVVDIGVILFHLKIRGNIMHQLSIILVTTAVIGYFSMASNLGSTPIRIEFNHNDTHGVPGDTRSIWYVRYIMWFINAPLLALLVFIGTGFPLGSVFTTLFMADFAVVCGLVGALVSSTYKWGYYTMGCCALVYVLAHLFMPGVDFPSPTGRSRAAHMGSVGLLTFLALIYPLIWGLCEGGNEITVIGEMIWYGIMDVLIFGFFIPYFLWAHHGVELDGIRPVSRPTKAAEAGVA